MPNLPNPFSDSGSLPVPPMPDETAASPGLQASDAAADLPDDLKQRMLAAIEEDYRFVLDEEKFLFDIGCVPDDFAKYIAMMDALADNDKPPLFLQQARA